MLIVVSPAKTLDFDSPLPAVRTTQPRMLDASAELIQRLRKLDSAGVARLMSVSDRIAALNVARFSSWHTPFDRNNARPAVFAFMGDVYTGLKAHEFDTATLKRAQRQLRILSGLYGVLRPLDLMQAYRLEMGTRLDTAHGDDLYQFWGERITAMLNKDLASDKSEVLVNLASNEYFRSVNVKTLKARIITPVFEDEKNGKFKIISFYAKKARGMMAAWILENGINDVEALSGFNVAGYRFSARDSKGDKLVFRRREKDAGKT